MTAMRYRKKPVEIKAMRWTGDNYEGLSTWVGDHVKLLDPPSDNGTLKLFVKANATWLPIAVGEWVAMDRHGFYPIKDDVFLESYEAVP